MEKSEYLYTFKRLIEKRKASDKMTAAPSK